MIEPTLSEVIRDAIESRLLDVHTATVAKVVLYDPITQTATVAPQIKRPLTTKDGDTQHEELCQIQNVPVGWIHIGSHFIHLPLTTGDYVMLHFTEDAMGAWRETDAVTTPGDLRKHALGSCVAYPMIVPTRAALTDAPNPGMDTSEAILGGGVWRVGGKTPAKFVALSTLTDAALNQIKTAFNAHTHLTAMGPSGPPVTPIATIASTAATKLKSE